MIRHNAFAASHNKFGYYGAGIATLRKMSTDEIGVLSARQEFGLPNDAKRVRFEVLHRRAKGSIWWYDGEMPGEKDRPDFIGYSHGRQADNNIPHRVVIDAFLNNEGTLRYGIWDDNVVLGGLHCLGYWR